MKVLVLILAAAASGLQWGAVSSGVRLGIGFGPDAPEPTLRVVFENVSAPEVQIPLGGKTVKGPLYNLIFRIRSPKGAEDPLFDMSGPTGKLKADPLIARLTKGKQYEVLLPMSKLVMLDNGKSRTLTELLAAHYSVRAMLDTTGNPREVTSYVLWAGNLSSGELRTLRLSR